MSKIKVEKVVKFKDLKDLKKLKEALGINEDPKGLTVSANDKEIRIEYRVVRDQ